MVLAHVMETTRELWPVLPEEEGSSVTIQIGELKSIDIRHVISCPANSQRGVWTLRKQNEIDAVVEFSSAQVLRQIQKSDGLQSIRILNFEELEDYYVSVSV